MSTRRAFEVLLFAAALLAGPSLANASHALPLLNMTQQNSDNSALCAGCTALTTSVFITADSDAATFGGNYVMDIEVQPVAAAFTNVPNYVSASMTKGGFQQTYPLTSVGPLASGSYKWQAREHVDTPSIGAWQPFNGGATAFVVATNVPAMSRAPLALLGLLFAGMAWFALRSRRLRGTPPPSAA